MAVPLLPTPNHHYNHSSQNAPLHANWISKLGRVLQCLPTGFGIRCKPFSRVTMVLYNLSLPNTPVLSQATLHLISRLHRPPASRPFYPRFLLLGTTHHYFLLGSFLLILKLSLHRNFLKEALYKAASSSYSVYILSGTYLNISSLFLNFFIISLPTRT